MPFEIPDSWEWTTIKEVCSKIGSGSTPRGSNYSLHGIPFFRSQNIYNSGLVYDDIKYISPEVHENMISTEVLANDVLLNITGGSLGRCAIVPSNFERGNVSQHVCILRPVQVLSAYLHYFCISTFFTQTMTLSGSGREGLPKYSLEQMQIPIPPLQEQNRIVEEIERWNVLIDEIDEDKQELLDFLQLAKSKVLSLAISGKLVPQDPNDEPAIELLRRINPSFKPCDTSHYEKLPEGWTVCRIQDAFDICMGSSPTGDSLNRQNKGVEFHQGKICFSDIYLQPSEVYTTKPTKLAESHTILLCVRAPVGMVNITKRVICIGRGLCALKPRQGVDLKFAFYAMQTHENNFDKQATGSTFKAISGSTIREEEFVLPPYNEQVRIRHAIETIFAQLDTITAEL